MVSHSAPHQQAYSHACHLMRSMFCRGLCVAACEVAPPLTTNDGDINAAGGMQLGCLQGGAAFLGTVGQVILLNRPRHRSVTLAWLIRDQLWRQCTAVCG